MATICAKVFVGMGSQVTFTEMSDVYGGGFIVEDDQITGKFARCRVKARKFEANTITWLRIAQPSHAAECAVQPQGSGRQQHSPNVPRQGRHEGQIRAARCHSGRSLRWLNTPDVDVALLIVGKRYQLRGPI
jgi:hypothetical protein